jgi:tryptophanyl-tRNA synthetase
MKEHYQRGGLGDMVVKKYLIEVLNDFLEPIRQRRKQWEQNPDAVMDILRIGTEAARAVAQETMKEVKEAMKLNYF